MMSAHGGDKFIYCALCDFKSSSQVQHLKHMKAAHEKDSTKSKASATTYCNICNFRSTSEIQHTKHMKTAHAPGSQQTKMCTFYLRGRCTFGEWCNFSHSNNEEYVGEDIPCRYQGNCLRTNCQFSHYEPFFRSKSSESGSSSLEPMVRKKNRRSLRKNKAKIKETRSSWSELR